MKHWGRIIFYFTLLVNSFIFINSLNLLDSDNKLYLKEQLLDMDYHSAFSLWHKHHEKHNHYQVESDEGNKRKEIFSFNNTSDSKTHKIL